MPVEAGRSRAATAEPGPVQSACCPPPCLPDLGRCCGPDHEHVHDRGTVRRERIVIIGAGPAGVAAAAQCRRLGIAPLLVDRNGVAGGLIENAFCVENYPGLEQPLSGPRFADRLREHLNRFGLGVESVEVTGVNRWADGFRLSCEQGVILTRTVIVACGTQPCRLGVAGEHGLEGRHLFYEVRTLLRQHPRPRQVLVIGGGEAACDYALTLAAAGARVHIVVRGPCLKARGSLARAVSATPRVRVFYAAECQDVAASPGFVVRLADVVTGRSFAESPEALLVAVGRRSAAPSLLEPLGEGVASSGAWSTPGLFLAGDARGGALGQIAMAVGEGIAAAGSAVAFLQRCNLADC